MAEVCTQGVDTGFVALGYAKVAALGVVQGITELLPISSTAHMRIVPALLGWQDPGSAFSAAMQLAALGRGGELFLERRAAARRAARSARSCAAISPTGIFGWRCGSCSPPSRSGSPAWRSSGVLNTCNSPLRSLGVIGWACIVMAVLLALAELRARHLRTLADATLADAMLVGVAQIGALIPGVSRSGSTLTAALWLGFKREEAARFSFLLGLPAIALAGLKELWELHKAHLDAHGWSILAVGLLVASLSAFVAIWALMRVLERYSAWPFVIYRGVLGVILLAGLAMGWLA